MEYSYECEDGKSHPTKGIETISYCYNDRIVVVKRCKKCKKYISETLYTSKK